MTRVKNLLLSRTVKVTLVAAAMFALPIAPAMADMGFGFRNTYPVAPPDYNGVPYNGSNIVIYALPDSGLHAGSVHGAADLTGRSSSGVGGTQAVTGFGGIFTMGAGAGVTFDPNPIAGGANPPNNIPYSVSTPANNTLDIMYGVANVQGGTGNKNLGVVALNDVAATNVTLTHGQGLASLPILVNAGVANSSATPDPFAPAETAVFTLSAGTDTTYTGFINAAGQIVTNPANHQGGVSVEVRKSLIGDLNGDGFVDGLDIDPFIELLFGSTYQDQFPFIAKAGTFTEVYAGDIGGGAFLCDPDGFSDGLDIDPFIDLIFGSGCTAPSPGASPSAVPEPSSIALALMGLVGGVAAYRRRRVR